jgi:glycosyltransferase involved in cell wall biosynthesis
MASRLNKPEPVRYSIVVPFFNEQENIPPLYVKLVEVMDGLGEPYEMVLVDDGSTDGTYKVLREIYSHDRRVHVVRLRRNFGQTAALKAGFDFARGEVIVTLDGDYQNDPEDIPRLLEKIQEGYDIVSGWRADRKEPLLTRRLPSHAANWLMAKISGVEIRDSGCTLKAYRRDILGEVQLYGELHRFIPALASWAGARIAELPVRDLPRRHGHSKYGLGRTFRVLLDLLSVKFLLDYTTRPMQFFGLPGLAGVGLGGAIGIFLLYEKFALGKSIMFAHGPLMLTAMLLILSGVQFLSIGLLGEMLARTYYESQQKPIYSVRERLSRRPVPQAADVPGSDSAG